MKDGGDSKINRLKTHSNIEYLSEILQEEQITDLVNRLGEKNRDSPQLRILKANTKASLTDVKEKKYVKTRAYAKGLEILTELKVLGIIGAAGDGKSMLSKMIAKEFIAKNQQYTPLLIYKPSDLNKVNFEDDKYLLILDDIYGKYNTLKDRKDQWPKHFENFRIRKERGQLVFIYIMRDYIYKSSKCHLDKYEIFSTQTELELHSGEFSLNYDEKEEILQFYKVHEDKIISILKTDEYFGFPAIASSVRKALTCGQLPTDFKSSHDFMLQELKMFWDVNKDVYTALSMVFCLHNVPMRDLERPNDKVKDVIKAIETEIYRKFELCKARDKVKDLSETFIRFFENNYMKMISLRDFVEVPFLTHFTENFIKMALEYCPFELLMTVVSTKPADQCIVINNYDELSFRFKRELQNNNNVILTHSAFLDSSFLSKFLNIEDINDFLREVNHLSLGEINAIQESGYFWHYISLYGDIDCLKIILLYFQDNLPKLVDKKTKFGWDVISLGAISKIKPIEKLDLLLKELKYDDLVTLPHFVVYSSDLSVIEHVDTKHTNFDIKSLDNKSRTILHNACDSIHDVSDIINFLVEKGFDLNAKDKDGCTPLQLAAGRGKTATVSILIENGASVVERDNMGRLPSHAACAAQGRRNDIDSSDVLRQLIKAGCPDNDPDKEGRTPFLEALVVVNTKCLQYLIKNLTRLDIQDKLRQPFMTEATMLNDIKTFKEVFDILITDKSYIELIDVNVLKECVDSVEKIKYLFKKGANLEVVDDQKRTVLHHACQSGTTETVNYLVNNTKLDVNQKDNNGWTPAVFCCWSEINPVDKLMILSSNGGELDTVDKSNISLLHHACQSGTTETVKYVVNEVNLDINHKNNNGCTPAFYCCWSEINPVDKLMILSSNGGELDTVDKSNRSLLQYACYIGTTETVKYLVNEVNLDINHKNNNGRTPAFFCCHSKINPVDKLMILSSNGGELDTVDNSNHSLLHHACQSGTTETVKYLVNEVNLDINHKNNNGYTPAVSCCHSKINPVDKLMILSSNGGELDTVDKSNLSLLHHACQSGTTETVKYLVNEVNLDINHKNNNGRTPAFFCCHSKINPVDKLMILSSNGGELDTVDNSNCSLLHHACRLGTTETVTYLVNEVNLDINHKNNNGRTPAFFCCWSEINPVDKLMILSSNGGELDTVDNSNCSLLHHACRLGTTETVTYLVNEVNLDINHKNNNGRTPAFFCCWSEINPVDKLMILSSNGGELDTVDKSNLSLLHHACQSGTTETVKYLVNEVNLDINHKNNNGYTPAVSCCHSKINPVDKLMILSSNGGELDTVDKSNLSLLHHACQSGTTETVKYLVNEVNLDINHKNNNGRTPAFFCCHSKINPVDKLMILSSNGGELDTVDNSNCSLLHHACRLGTTETVTYLVNEVNLDINHKNNNGRTPAFFCCWSEINPVDKLMILSSNGGELDTVDKSNLSLLHHACQSGTTETVKYLVNEVNLDINHKNNNGRTPAFFCCHSKINPVDKLMILSSNGGELDTVNNSNRSLLHHACRLGTTETVTYLVNEVNLDINHKNNNGRTPAFFCCWSEINPVDKLMILSSNGGELDTVDKSNLSLLHHACQSGTTETVKYLVNEVNLDINHKNNNGH
ncbi:serine/threonine-protein phosphatase 6 regulatory ankyrin repeat subunit A [Patella vulgata]|uniref:serine/threonine-protein phosphatase 6 regulatory ankyrin repeat subunit A n=1 Tax=Patella vulgata TaxID=6465 RepID=UPI0024A9F0F3|nr:serine/threonine-protein phosphatase 6 regulatory ankyrin repeat subunit A [Patella vulgata]